jgi:hypothetical protein
MLCCLFVYFKRKGEGKGATERWLSIFMHRSGAATGPTRRFHTASSSPPCFLSHIIAFYYSLAPPPFLYR